MPFLPAQPAPAFNPAANWARPIPTISQPAPSGLLTPNIPGPMGAQGVSAPPIEPVFRPAPSGLPSGVPSAIPAAAVPAAAGAGGGIIVPAVVLAVPLAVGMGEVGMPGIMGGSAEKEAMRRAGNPPTNPFSPKMPGTPNPAPNPPGPQKPKPASPKKPLAKGLPGTWFLQTYNKGVKDWTYSFGNRSSSDVPVVTTRGPGWIEGRFADGSLAGKWGDENTQNESPSFAFNFIPDGSKPPNPTNPAPPSPSSPQPAPQSPLTPNPNNPAPNPNPSNPNPSNPNQSSPTNPSNPKPTNPNPSNPKPTNPGPKTPNQTNPNPSNPNPSNPSNPNPTNPNPTSPSPTAPTPTTPSPTNPTTANPTDTTPNPSNPSNPTNTTQTSPNPLNPIPTLPTPVSPGPTNPNPNPTKPDPEPQKPKLECKYPIAVLMNVTVFAGFDDKGVVKKKTESIKCLPDEVDRIKLLFQRLYELESKKGKETEDGAIALPEAWAVRRGVDRPQLVIVYAEIFNSGKLGTSRWSITVPHYRGTSKSKILAPKYRRGNWQGQLTLNDGSTIVINANSSEECKRSLNKLKILVPIDFRTRNGKAIKPRVVDNPNIDFKSCNVVPVLAKYYATGQKDLAPTWSQSLRK